MRQPGFPDYLLARRRIHRLDRQYDETIAVAPDDTELRLARIESGIRQNEEAGQLMASLESFDPGAEHPAHARYLTARAIVENRLGLFRTAMATLRRARIAARRNGDRRQLSAIAAAAALVHGWRGDARSAALDLVEAFSYGHFAGDPTTIAAAIAEGARLNIEAGRFEVALELIELAETLPDAALGAQEHARLAVNRCQVLNLLGRPDDALAAADGVAAVLPPGSARLAFLLALERGRALVALARDGEARQIAVAIEERLPEDQAAFERVEFALLTAALALPKSPAEAVTLLERAVERFNSDDLPHHEINARSLLAEALLRAGRGEDAQACIVEALRRAVSRQLPSIADRVRARIAELWSSEDLIRLAKGPEDEASEDAEQRFLVAKQLGAGGSATVYRAFDLDTGEEVAIKRFRFSAAEAGGAAVLEQLRREVLAEARRRVAGVVHIRYLNVARDGELVLVEDFVEGPSLRDLLNGTEARGRLLAILSAVTRTVGALHRAGLVHRDLKPDNVIVRDGVPVVMDFGIASIAGVVDAIPRLGTPPYAAPEIGTPHAAGGAVGAEDVYALGKMAEEIWESRRPAASSGFLAGLRHSAQDDKMPDELATLVRAMTEPDPSRRFSDPEKAATILWSVANSLKPATNPQ
jgi:tetratricopeptide (TPR) repeat protein